MGKSAHPVGGARNRRDALFATAGRRQAASGQLAEQYHSFRRPFLRMGPRKANETTSIRCQTKRIFTTFAENRYLYAIGNDLTNESSQRCDRHNTDMAVRPSVRSPTSRSSSSGYTSGCRSWRSDQRSCSRILSPSKSDEFLMKVD